MLRGNDLYYGWVARLFHWLMALLLGGLFATGWWATELSYYDPLYNTVPHWHRSLGVLAGLLVCLRLAWLLVDRRPPPPAGQPAWERMAARATHWILYGLMVAVPVTGYLLSTADGRSVDVFGLFQVPALLPRSSGREEIAADLHYYLAFGGGWLVLLHAAAALKHALIDRDGVLRRMTG